MKQSQHKEGHIIRLYKEKEIKGKGSNEAGIKLSSNLGTLCKRTQQNHTPVEHD